MRRSPFRRMLAVVIAILAAAVVSLPFTTATAATATGSPPGQSRVSCTQAASSSVKRCIRVEPTALSALSSAQRAERSSILKARAAKAKAAKTKSAQAGPAAAASLPAAPAACAVWSTPDPDRFDSCADQVWTVYSYTVSEDGVETITGTFSFEDQQWTHYSADSSSWLHGAFVIGYDFGNTGDLEDGFSGYLESNCSIAAGVCTAASLTGAPDPQPADVTPGSDLEYAWTESDNGPSATTDNAENTLDGNLGVNWEILALPPLIVYDRAQLVGRCDTMTTTDDTAATSPDADPAATGTDGCADENFTPTLFISSAVDGASADMINWAQNNLSGKWGLQGTGQPLHRQANSSVRKNNRKIVCDSSFTADSDITTALVPYNDKDSCDEFPFAGTYESGAQKNGVDGNQKPYVTTGADCAQVTAKHTATTGKSEATDWKVVTINGTPSTSAPCVRGHIPLLLNKLVGGQYGNFIQSNRLIDKDPFWLQVTG